LPLPFIQVYPWTFCMSIRAAGIQAVILKDISTGGEGDVVGHDAPDNLGRDTCISVDETVAKGDDPAYIRDSIRQRLIKADGLLQGLANDLRLPLNRGLERTSRDLIHRHLCLVHRFLEAGVLDRIKLHKIDWCFEKRLELLCKAKVVVRVLNGRHRLESDEEIEVSDVREGSSTDGPAEEKEPFNSEISAQSGNGFFMIDDLPHHARILVEKAACLHT
jgi:hypothetical protein